MPGKISLKAGLCLLLGMLWLVAGCGRPGTAPADTKFVGDGGSGPVVVLGDSLSEGYLIPPDKTWVPRVAETIGAEIVNLGKCGVTTEQSIPRVQKEVLPLKPRLVVVELGGNDALGRVEKSKTQANLETIIREIQAEKIPILLLGVRGGILSDPFQGMYEELADEHALAYVPDILDGIVGHKELLVDEFHPNEAGHAKIADRLEPVLAALLAEQERLRPKEAGKI